MLSRRRAERHSLPLAWHQLAFRGDLVASRRPGRNASLDSSLADHAMQLNMTSKHGSSLKAVFLLARPLLPAADPCQYGSCPDELRISLKSKKSRSPVSLHLRSCGPHSPVSKKAPNSLDDQYAAWLVRASAETAVNDYPASAKLVHSPMYSLMMALPGKEKSRQPCGFKALSRRSPIDPCSRSSPAGPDICSQAPLVSIHRLSCAAAISHAGHLAGGTMTA